MELAGLVFGVAGLAGLFKVALEAWEFVDAGRSHDESLGYFRTRLDNQRVIFLIWAEALGFFSPEGYNKALDSPRGRAHQVSLTLKQIALLFSNTDQLVNDYGFRVYDQEISGGTNQQSSRPAIFQRRYDRLKNAFLGNREARTLFAAFRSKARRLQIDAGIWKKFKWSLKDEKKSAQFLEKISLLVDDLEKLTRGIVVMQTKAELAIEAVADVSEAGLLEIEESSKDKATIISSAASSRLRAIEARSVFTATTATGTFVTAQTHPSRYLEPGGAATERQPLDMERSTNTPLDFQALEVANRRAIASLVLRESRLARLSPASSRQQVNRRLLTEMKGWAKSREPNGWFTLGIIQDTDLRKFLGTIRGPSGTPYEGGIFHVRINVGEEYPFQPPVAWFLTKILHPNIDMYGAICLDILSSRFEWSPAITLEKLLISVVSILHCPNWDEPVDDALPRDFLHDHQQFERSAISWTKQYATGRIINPGERQDGFCTVFSERPPDPKPSMVNEAPGLPGIHFAMLDSWLKDKPADAEENGQAVKGPSTAHDLFLSTQLGKRRMNGLVTHGTRNYVVGAEAGSSGDGRASSSRSLSDNSKPHGTLTVQFPLKLLFQIVWNTSKIVSEVIKMDSTEQSSSVISTKPEPLRVFPTTFPTGFLTRVTTEKERALFSFYGTFDKEFLVAEAASFLATCTDAELPLLSNTLADFLNHTSKDCISEALDPESATQACWLTIRVWHPTDEFVIPRWHRDGRMFDCSCQGGKSASGRSLPHSKYAVTLLGPGTLLLKPGQQHVDDTLTTRKWWLDEERKPLADLFTECEMVPVQTGQIIRFSWGEEDSPVHSEPDSSGSDRVFVSVLYGSKEELQDMCKIRKTRYGQTEIWPKSRK